MTHADDLVAAYRAGTSLNQLSKDFGHSRDALGRILKIRGIELRGQSDAERLKWATLKQSPALIERQLGKAWQAARDRDADLEQRICALYQDSLLSSRQIAAMLGASDANVRRILQANALGANRIAERRAFGAQGLYTRNNISPAEQPLRDELRRRGLLFVGQRRIANRNVDLALDELGVAVEISRRHFSDSKNLARDRLKQIFSEHWRLLVVYDYQRRGIDTPKVADQVIAFCEAARIDPAARGQYGVIDGDGQPVAFRRRYFHGWARVKGF